MAQLGALLPSWNLWFTVVCDPAFRRQLSQASVESWRCLSRKAGKWRMMSLFKLNSVCVWRFVYQTMSTTPVIIYVIINEATGTSEPLLCHRDDDPIQLLTRGDALSFESRLSTIQACGETQKYGKTLEEINGQRSDFRERWKKDFQFLWVKKMAQETQENLGARRPAFDIIDGILPTSKCLVGVWQTTRNSHARQSKLIKIVWRQ